VLLFDCTNAFGTMHREAALDVLAAECPEVAAALRPWLTQPARCRLRRAGDAEGWEEIFTNDGLPQGCAGSPVAFSLGLRPCIEDLKRRLAGRLGREAADGVMVLAYLDDITVICEEELAEAAIDCMEEALAPAGLRLNLSKLCVFTGSLQRPPRRAPRSHRRRPPSRPPGRCHCHRAPLPPQLPTGAATTTDGREPTDAP
jgi:hypothetical protein